VFTAFATLLAILFFEAAVMFRASMLAAMPAVPKWAHGLAWPLAVIISAVVRRFLIQYVGDVAAYVQPQELDRFNELRTRIKQQVWNAAASVYAAADQYDDVLFVGHSLGSVVAYDTLNRLLREEALGRTPFAVQSRTRLLLTFGSPLDKTAFLFSLQGNTTEAREALAASVQPLLAFPERRPQWINIYSPWDLISGSLDFYDLPGKPNPVTNLEDPDASVLLGAHTQYWSNALLFDRLHRSLL
jgi:pimeloyl-ACP methyl ester carboxylesterase